MKKNFQTNKGFTLIELLVVISIISLLSSIVLATINGTRAKARDARRISDIKEIEKALILVAENNNGNLPLTSAYGRCLGTNGTCWNGLVSGDASLNTSIQQFLPNIPADPSGRTGLGDRYVYADKDSLFSLHCAVSYISGPFILWSPDNLNPNSDSLCKGLGSFVCCGGGIDCSAGYYCAYPIQY